MNQAMLMDLWNNQVGRELANNKDFKDMSYKQLFDMAVKEDYLITNASLVYDKLGITGFIIKDNDWAVNVEWNMDTGNITFIKDEQRITLKIGV
ncbi:MAG: hypothetical protein IKW06_06065 [Clostridia bacterium]|nr:hypothetical protein [Clostridia bacterium]